MKLSPKRFGSVLSVNERYGHLAMMTFSLLVAGSFSFGKLIAPKIDPVSLTAARFFFGALLLFLALLATKRFHFGHGDDVSRGRSMQGCDKPRWASILKKLKKKSPRRGGDTAHMVRCVLRKHRNSTE